VSPGAPRPELPLASVSSSVIHCRTCASGCAPANSDQRPRDGPDDAARARLSTRAASSASIRSDWPGELAGRSAARDRDPSLVAALRASPRPGAGHRRGELRQFAGAQPEAQVRQWITELLTLAQREFGLGAPGDTAPQPADPPMDPALAAAYDALAAEDLDGAARALQNVLARIRTTPRPSRRSPRSN